MLFIALLLLFISFVILLSLVASFFAGAIWSPTPTRTVRRMLEMARVKPGEKVYDLGSGGGKIAIEAAREFRAKAVGVEINPFLALFGKLNVSMKRVCNSVRLVWGDLYNQDLRDADVVAVYLSTRGNEKLRKKLEGELKKGVRVVSHRWQFKGWRPTKYDEKYKVYLYVIGVTSKARQ